MSDYLSIHLAVRPQAGPITQGLFELKRQPIPEIRGGEVLIKQTHMSLDPAKVACGFSLAPSHQCQDTDPKNFAPPQSLGHKRRWWA